MKSISLVAAAASVLLSCTSPATAPTQEQEAHLLSLPGRQAHSVYLTQDHQGRPAVAWTEEDTSTKAKHFFYAVSPDQGNSFPEKVELPIHQSAKLHAEGMPKIAFRGDGSVYAVYDVGMKSEQNPYASEIHYVVSSDAGKTWSSPESLHADTTPYKSHSYFDLAALPGGEIGACWLDTAYGEGGRPLKFAHTDATGNFVDEIVVDSFICECCRTAIDCDPSGKISIVYRDIIQDSIRDISFVASTDMGKSFSQPRCFSGDNWNIQGCPHNGPDVGSDGKSTCAVWFTGASEKGVYYSEIGSAAAAAPKKQRISADGQHIQMAALSDGRCVLVYDESLQQQDKSWSPVRARLMPEGKPLQLTPDEVVATLPVAIGTPDGGFVAAWLQEKNGIHSVYWRKMPK